ncbi:hypothetical protein BDZ97DRAFT_1643133, partial [Flammula alnicola]
VALRSYLHKIQQAESPICESCEKEPETVTHFLKLCPAFDDQRATLQEEIDPMREIEIDLLGDIQARPALLRYIHATGRFRDTHG